MGLGAGGGEGQGKGRGEGRGKGQGKGQGQDDNGLIAGVCWLIFVCIVIIVALCGLNIAKIVVGAIYMNDCPVEKLIPIYLIVGGCAPVLLGGLNTLKKKEEDDPFESEAKKKIRLMLKIIGGIGLLFNFSWLMCGSVWVFGNYSDVMDGCGGSNDCCDRDLIKFALAVAIIDWIFYALILLAICCVCGVVCCKVICAKEKIGP